MNVASIYIHIPFCRSKCHYCDFASVPLAGREQDLAAYPALLHKEWQLYQQTLAIDSLETIYLGGGTPSLLAPAQLQEILSFLSSAAEITLEANPESVSPEQLAQLREVGINRLSLGVQSFAAAALQKMGRSHSPEQAYAAVAAAKAAGYANISIDLIYGLPEQSLADWQADLKQALALNVPHLSLYGLSLHEGTYWGDLAARGSLATADQDLSADMLELAIAELSQAGYSQYELSNFARPGFESRHNLAYWQRKNYLGLGVAAASCLANCRSVNVTTLEEYQACLAAGALPVAEREELDIEQVLAEAVFLGLRLQQGICLADYQAQYGVDPRKYFKRQIAKLLQLELLAMDETHLWLTERGRMLGNEAFAEFV